MKIVSTSYTNTVQFTDPVAWLQRINFYTGILEALSKHYQVESIEQINFQGFLECKGIKYHFLNFKKPVLYFPWQLHNHVKKLKPDIVLINGFIFPLQVIQLRLKLGRSAKVILIHRSEKPFTGLKKYLQRFADRFVDAYLFTSLEFGNSWIENRNISSTRKIHEVMHGSSVFQTGNIETARNLLAVNGSPVFLWVGRFDDNKDPLTVVKAFKDFLVHQPSARLYMIYHTEELLEELKSLIADTDSIKLVGKVEHGELQNWYNASDFIISGSHYEGGGIAVCEAMSCGCVPVLTDIISFRKLTGPGNCGLLYEPGNAASLLKILMQTVELNLEIERTKTLQQFNTELSFEAIAKKIDKVIATLKP